MSGETPSEPARVKSRLPFAQRPLAHTVLRGALILYGVIATTLAALALYMGAVEHRALTSAYVVGPAIGAAWFALRLFMLMAPQNQAKD